MNHLYLDVIVHGQVADGVGVNATVFGERRQHFLQIHVAVLIHEFVEYQTVLHALK